VTIDDRKEREKEILRRKILDTAMRLFVEEGYENVSMRKIAAIIEYSPTTIYRFFESKEDLLRTMSAESYKVLSNRFEIIKAEGSDDPLATLKSLIREYLRFGLENPNVYSLYVDLCRMEMGENTMYETVGGVRYKAFHSWYALIEQSVEREIIKGDDITSILFLIWNATHGFVIHRIQHPDLPWKPLEEDIDALIDMIFGGLEK